MDYEGWKNAGEGRMKGKPEANQSKPTEVKTSEELCKRFLEIKDILTFGKIEAFSNIRQPLSEAEQNILRRELLERWFSEAEHWKQIKRHETVIGSQNREIQRLEGKKKNLQIDNQSLLEITQYNSDNLNTYAKWWDTEKQKRKVLEGVLSDIRKHYENRPNLNIHLTSEENLNLYYAWTNMLGVLLNQKEEK